MKQSILSKMFLGAVLALSLGMAACAKKDGGSVRTAPRGGLVQNNVPNNATCTSGTGTGTLQVTDVNSVMDLVSATISPTSFSNVCKVNFSAAFKFDSAGNIVNSSSSVLFQIVDGWVGQVVDGKTIAPYEIQFANAYSGSYNRSTGIVQAIFVDNYGGLLVYGQVNGANVTGTVYFYNNTAVSGYTPTSGLNQWATLGQFSIPAATLIK